MAKKRERQSTAEMNRLNSPAENVFRCWTKKKRILIQQIGPTTLGKCIQVSQWGLGHRIEGAATKRKEKIRRLLASLLLWHSSVEWINESENIMNSVQLSVARVMFSDSRLSILIYCFTKKSWFQIIICVRELCRVRSFGLLFGELKLYSRDVIHIVNSKYTQLHLARLAVLAVWLIRICVCPQFAIQNKYAQNWYWI